MSIGLGSPENLVIDIITHNLYFTDAKMKHIGVCNNDGSACTVLHNKNIDKPRAVAVSPLDGYNIMLLLFKNLINFIIINY